MTNIYSFIDIFNKELITEQGTINLNKIVIPKIQRDYAQGRKDSNIKRVREKFIHALYNAFVEKPIVLDFIYGDINENGEMTPLDGQQRLTTLFLLHWFVAKKEKVDFNEYKFLEKFSYETRYSARDFCSYLVKFNPSFNKESISKEIINESWFPLEWEKDQTISSMLVMLDTIEAKFSNLNDMWNKLKNGAITFYFLPIKDMGLTDELYIKMNSRGKPLTKFENFKAELEESLKTINQDMAKDLIQKIDIEWTDLLWIYKDDTNTIDDFFLRYFKYICDIICYKNNDSPFKKEFDEIDLIKIYFSKDSENIERNIEILRSYFECWVNISKKIGIQNFFDQYMSYEYQTNKIKISTRYIKDIFKDCIENNGTYIENRNSRKFTLGRQVLLYAFITYLLNINTIDEKDFIRRIRIVNNLINNSIDEINISETRAGGNRIPKILEQVDSIIINGKININLNKNFNVNQLIEENFKIEWTKNNVNYIEELFRVEDNDLLYGQISIIGLENHHLFNAFNSLFECNLDKINCAMLAIGDYGQVESRNQSQYQLGSTNESSWKKLFHQGGNKNFDITKKVLCQLLSMTESFNNNFLDNIINDYITHCEKENQYTWKYYYIKYEEFRPNKFGKYYFENSNEKYVLTAMVTESNLSENAYSPFLKCVDIHNKLSKDYFGKRIIDGNKYILNTETSYTIMNSENNELLYEFKIKQKDGVDLENRIEKFKEFYKTEFNTI